MVVTAQSRFVGVTFNFVSAVAPVSSGSLCCTTTPVLQTKRSTNPRPFTGSRSALWAIVGGQIHGTSDLYPPSSSSIGPQPGCRRDSA